MTNLNQMPIYEESKEESVNKFSYKIVNEKKQGLVGKLCCYAEDSDSDEDQYK